MREIKFRAWDRRENRWRGMWIFRGGHKTEQRFYDEPEIFDLSSYFNDCIVTQYTGLKDKNGKEIYEGDIVKMLSRSLSQVYFADGGFCVDVGGELVGLHPDFLGRYRTVEVIGNIYENPELLKEKK